MVAPWLDFLTVPSDGAVRRGGWSMRKLTYGTPIDAIHPSACFRLFVRNKFALVQTEKGVIYSQT